MSELDKIINTQEFATLPNVATRILRLLENIDVDIRELSRIIESDPSLTLKIIKVANSPLYASRVEIDSVSKAIQGLGINRVANIVLGISIFSNFMVGTSDDLEELIEDFWWHSSCTAIVSKSLCTKLKLNFKEREFIGGLLHDIGKLAMIQYNLEDYLKVKLLVDNGANLLEAEREVFEVDHNQVGTEIAKLWRLPQDLVDIIQYHYNPTECEANKELISLVRLSNIFCEMWGAGFNEGIKELHLEKEDYWSILVNKDRVADFDIEKTTFELEQDFKNTTQFLALVKA